MLFLLMILFPILAGTAASLVKVQGPRQRHALYAGVVLITDVLGALAIFLGSPVSFLNFSEGVKLRFVFDNTGILFARTSYEEDPENGVDKTLADPWLFRDRNGRCSSYILHRKRRCRR